VGAMTARPDWSMRAPDASTPQQQGVAWLSCEELQQLRRQAIGFIRWADKVLGLLEAVLADMQSALPVTHDVSG